MDKNAYYAELTRVSRQNGCSRRTAALIIRNRQYRTEALVRQASQVAAHIDWDNRTDVPQEMREMRELIYYYGVNGVSNSERNSIIKKLPAAIQIARG
jgi:lambda repressor-like predicted transcriptional regulator